MRNRVWLIGAAMCVVTAMGQEAKQAKERKQGNVIKAELGTNAEKQQVVLEVVYLPPGEFWMGSTPEEKKWATGIEGGAQPGTERESYAGEKPRRMRVPDGFWRGRTEVTVGQFRPFVEAAETATEPLAAGGGGAYFTSKSMLQVWSTALLCTALNSTMKR